MIATVFFDLNINIIYFWSLMTLEISFIFSGLVSSVYQSFTESTINDLSLLFRMISECEV